MQPESWHQGLLTGIFPSCNAAGGQGLLGLCSGGWEAENSQTALSTLGFILSAWEPLVAFVCLLTGFEGEGKKWEKLLAGRSGDLESIPFGTEWT